MVGSIKEPSRAVVAIVEPEIAENTVPATMAMTDSRPGTRRMSSAKASIALRATPVWNDTSPIRMKNGIGVSEKLVTDWIALRASCGRPGSPPRNKSAPTMLMAKNPNATESPRLISATRPPNSRKLAATQLIRRSSDRCRFAAARRPARQQALEAEYELDGQQREDDRQRRQQPPFRKYQILDRERVQPCAGQHHIQTVAHQNNADEKSN